MNYQRGDVILGSFPHADQQGTSRRPLLVVQADTYNQSLYNAVVAQITSNLTRQSDPAHLLIDLGHADWSASELLSASLVSCYNLATLHESTIDRVIGNLSHQTMLEIDKCLKAALGIA